MHLCEFSGCDRPQVCNSLCKTHSEQKRRGKPLTQIKYKRPKDLMPYDNFFLDKNGCHVFRGGLDNKGYGRAMFEGRMTRIHRLAWEKKVGPIPEGMVVDHKCRNRACCNVDHLRVVTPQVNSTENVVGIGWQINASKTHCLNGHEFTDENTVMSKDGKRVCHTCRNMRARNYYHANKKKAGA